MPQRFVATVLTVASFASLALGTTASADPATILVTSPTQGSTVEGTVKVTASASASASSGEHIESISFFDGVNEIGTTECENQPTCAASIEWKATGLSGVHTLTARANQSGSESTTSAPVNVTVVSPPPSVSILTPTNGSTVKGTVAVTVSGATDPSQDDYPTRIYVYDGVNELGEVECQGQQTCQGTVNWRATGLSGVHTLSAKLATHDSLSVRSASVTVTVLSPPPSVRITSPPAGARLGGTIVVGVAGATDPSQADYPTYMNVYDGSHEIGEIKCQGQQSCAGSIDWDTKGLMGTQTLAAVIHTQTGRTGTSRHVVVGGSPPHHKPRAVTKPHATGSCHLASRVVARRHLDRGRCALPGVPAGTIVAVQYRSRSGAWVTAVRDRVHHTGQFKFSLRGKKKASYALTVLVYANRVYAMTRLPLGTLRIG